MRMRMRMPLRRLRPHFQPDMEVTCTFYFKKSAIGLRQSKL